MNETSPKPSPPTCSWCAGYQQHVTTLHERIGWLIEALHAKAVDRDEMAATIERHKETS